MQRGRAEQEYQWGSDMISGVEFCLKVKPVFVPDLSIPLPEPSSLCQYEYDFLHEKQVLADHDEYLNAKRQAKHFDPINNIQGTSGITTTECLSSLDIRSFNTSSPVSVPTAAETVGLRPPIAASHLMQYKILEPQKSDKPLTASLVQSPRQPLYSPIQKYRAAPDLYDFDLEADDPFASVELKTINEFEELKHVLMSSATCKLSVGNVSSHFSGKSAVGEISDPSGISKPVGPHLPETGTLTYVEHSKQLPQLPEQVNSVDLLNCSSRLSPVAFRRPAETAFSLQTTHNMKCPLQLPRSVSDAAASSSGSVHSSVSCGSRSLQTYNKYRRSHSSYNYQPNVLKQIDQLDHPLKFRLSPDITIAATIPNKCVEADSPKGISASLVNMNSFITPETPMNKEFLLFWIKQHNLPEYRVQRLIDLNEKCRGSMFKNLDIVKTLLMDQLRVANTLINQYSESSEQGHLSEDSALVIASVYWNDISRAYQLANLVIDMEKRGISQQLMQLHILNPNLNENKVISQLMLHHSKTPI